MRSLLPGSIKASSRGLRARMRPNSVASVGDVAGWLTSGLFSWRLLPLPPAFRQIPDERGGFGPFYPIPSGNPLVAGVKHGNCVEARHQRAIERADRGYEVRMITGFQQCRDRGVDGGILCAHVVARALRVGGLAAPIKRLLVAGRQRLVPAVLDHIELITQPALVELHGIDRAHLGLDAGA